MVGEGTCRNSRVHPTESPIAHGSAAGGSSRSRPYALLSGYCPCGLWLRCVYLVADSRFSSDPLTDPHGYGLIFGTVLGIVAGSVAAVVVPRAFPRQHRHLVRRVATLVFLAASISLITLLVSA